MTNRTRLDGGQSFKHVPETCKIYSTLKLVYYKKKSDHNINISTLLVITSWQINKV